MGLAQRGRNSGGDGIQRKGVSLENSWSSGTGARTVAWDRGSQRGEQVARESLGSQEAVLSEARKGRLAEM